MLAGNEFSHKGLLSSVDQIIKGQQTIVSVDIHFSFFCKSMCMVLNNKFITYKQKKKNNVEFTAPIAVA